MRERLRARSLRTCSLGIFQLTTPKHNSSNFIKSTDKLTLLPWTRVSQVKVTSASRIMRLQRKLSTKQTWRHKLMVNQFLSLPISIERKVRFRKAVKSNRTKRRCSSQTCTSNTFLSVFLRRKSRKYSVELDQTVSKLFPSNLIPFIAKKILFFFTFELSNEIPEKKKFLNFLFTFGM